VVSEKAYKVILHFCIFIFLQMMTCIALSVRVWSNNQLLSAEISMGSVLLFSFALFSVILLALNNFWNLLLTDLKIKAIGYRY
jgi:isoprenylcysteine carboxyl methyltransferase (ICMT) family protein YpbQ